MSDKPNHIALIVKNKGEEGLKVPLLYYVNHERTLKSAPEGPARRTITLDFLGEFLIALRFTEEVTDVNFQIGECWYQLADVAPKGKWLFLTSDKIGIPITCVYSMNSYLQFSYKVIPKVQLLYGLVADQDARKAIALSSMFSTLMKYIGDKESVAKHIISYRGTITMMEEEEYKYVSLNLTSHSPLPLPLPPLDSLVLERWEFPCIEDEPPRPFPEGEPTIMVCGKEVIPLHRGTEAYKKMHIAAGGKDPKIIGEVSPPGCGLHKREVEQKL